MDILKFQIFFLCVVFSSAYGFKSNTNTNNEVKEIFEKLEELQNGLDEMSKENKFLSENIRSLQTENQNFRKTIIFLTEKCQRVELDLEELKRSKVDMKSETEQEHDDIDSGTGNQQSSANFQNYSSAVKSGNISELVSKMDTNDNKSMDRRSSLIRADGSYPDDIFITVPTNPTVTIKPQKIGFLAYNPRSQLDLRIHRTVQFPTALTNEGSAYNPSSSIFKAPVDGLYFFSVTILSYHGEDMEAEIVLNGNGKVYTYSGGETTMYGSGSTSAVLQLHANDDVWIRILNNKVENDGIIRVHGDRWSSFCGFKIA